MRGIRGGRRVGGDGVELAEPAAGVVHTDMVVAVAQRAPPRRVSWPRRSHRHDGHHPDRVDLDAARSADPTDGRF